MAGWIKTILAVVCVVEALGADCRAGNYQPPPSSLSCLGKIAEKLPQAAPVSHHFDNERTAIFLLPGKQLYYESVLNLDSDGSRFATKDASGRKPDRTGSPDTSLRYPGADKKSVDAGATSYFVLPGGFYRQFGIRPGDIAAVIYKEKLEFAIFADVGPRQKLGEGSIALHRALGHEPILHGKYHDEAIDGRVITIVFPGSGDATPQTPQRVRKIGKARFIELGGNPSACSSASPD